MDSIPVRPSAPPHPDEVGVSCVSINIGKEKDDIGYDGDSNSDGNGEYNANDTMSDRERECSICLDEVRDAQKYVLIDCECKMNKICHAHCVFDWLEKNSVCPTCSEPISASQIYGNFEDIETQKNYEGECAEGASAEGVSAEGVSAEGVSAEEMNPADLEILLTDREEALRAYLQAMQRRKDRRDRLAQRLEQERRFRHENAERAVERDMRNKKWCCICTVFSFISVFIIVSSMDN